MTNSPFYVSDAHPLLWFLSADKRLSPRAKELLMEAQRGEREIGIPIVALTEAARAIEKRRVQLTLEQLLDMLEQTSFTVLPFDMPVFRELLTTPATLELHDRVIAATAKAYGAVLITRDPEIRQIADTFW
jgi:predicted nucleic acid-binding protein